MYNPCVCRLIPMCKPTYAFVLAGFRSRLRDAVEQTPEDWSVCNCGRIKKRNWVARAAWFKCTIVNLWLYHERPLTLPWVITAGDCHVYCAPRHSNIHWWQFHKEHDCSKANLLPRAPLNFYCFRKVLGVEGPLNAASSEEEGHGRTVECLARSAPSPPSLQAIGWRCSCWHCRLCYVTSLPKRYTYLSHTYTRFIPYLYQVYPIPIPCLIHTYTIPCPR